MLVKRSFTLCGHRTSVALEPEFWQALDAIAQKDGKSAAALVAETDAGRAPRENLASLLRLRVLRVLAA
ncbi:MAG: ribbon-helix-helix domain-containing protein [Acidisphaera sp.]|nr:ribbon-helix-helix domain-containing protein [Acidisphaera sp.]